MHPGGGSLEATLAATNRICPFTFFQQRCIVHVSGGGRIPAEHLPEGGLPSPVPRQLGHNGANHTVRGHSVHVTRAMENGAGRRQRSQVRGRPAAATHFHRSLNPFS